MHHVLRYSARSRTRTSPASVPSQAEPSGPIVIRDPSLPASRPVPVRTLHMLRPDSASSAVRYHALTPVSEGRLVQA